MSKIYEVLDDPGDLYDSVVADDPQLIYDYAYLGNSLDINHIPADNTNVLHFNDVLYKLDRNLPHQPIVLYKIPPDWLLETGAAPNTCYFERRQLEIHHVNDNYEKLIIVIPFRSFSSPSDSDDAPVLFAPALFAGEGISCADEVESVSMDVSAALDPNSIDISELLDNIKNPDRVYYDDATYDNTTIIFYTEQHVEWDTSKLFWNGNFMDDGQRTGLNYLCNEDTYDEYAACGRGGLQIYNSENYPSELLTVNTYSSVEGQPYTISVEEPYLNLHFLSSERDAAKADFNNTKRILNGTKYNKQKLTSKMRSDIGLGVDTSADVDTSVGGVDDDSIFIDCSPVNTSEEEILTKLNKDSLLKLNSGYTFNNIIEQITTSINNAIQTHEHETFVSRDPYGNKKRQSNFHLNLNKELKKMENRFAKDMGSKRKGTSYMHYKRKFLPIIEITIGIIIGICSCIVFNIILNNIIKPTNTVLKS
jgi:hypothetical protein